MFPYKPLYNEITNPVNTGNFKMFFYAEKKGQILFFYHSNVNDSKLVIVGEKNFSSDKNLFTLKIF